MTTVVAVQTEDDVLLAWDSLATRDNEAIDMTEQKVWCRDGVVFGFSGSMRLMDLLYTMEVPEYDGSEARGWVIKELVPAIQKVIEESSQTKFVDEDGGVNAGIFVVVDGTCFSVDSMLSPLTAKSGIYAMGSGGDYARGALYAGASPMWALEIASQIDPYTGGEIHFSTYNRLVLEEA